MGKTVQGIKINNPPGLGTPKLRAGNGDFYQAVFVVVIKLLLRYRNTFAVRLLSTWLVCFPRLARLRAEDLAPARVPSSSSWGSHDNPL